MKKTLFIAIAVLAGLAGTKYYISNQETSESSLLLQNVEAQYEYVSYSALL